jgi:hypothetical protein
MAHTYLPILASQVSIFHEIPSEDPDIVEHSCKQVSEVIYFRDGLLGSHKDFKQCLVIFEM